MGLLEKALEYKKEINQQGHETLIDRIAGPAETSLLDEENSSSLQDDKDESVKDMDSNNKAAADNSASNNNDVKDITDKIYEVSGNYPDDTGDIEELSEEENDEFDDDLFELPDDDAPRAGDSSIVKDDAADTLLNKENESPSAEDGDRKDEIVNEALEEVGPLGPDDEPVLPGDGPPVSEDAGEDEEIDSQVKFIDDIEVEVVDEVTLQELDKEQEDKEQANKEELTEGEVSEVMSMEDTASQDRIIKKKKYVQEVKKKIEEEYDIDGDEYVFDDFQDYSVLYEILKDISRADTKEELYDIILFSINGQIGCSSSSVMIAKPDDETKWLIRNSLGIEMRDEIVFNSTEGILEKLKSRIIDIEDYKDEVDCIDQYNLLLSIDTRLIAPINFKGNLLGALILGDKITGEQYSEEEVGIIHSVCSASATLFNKVAAIERLNNENLGLKSDMDYSMHLNDLQEEILSDSSLKDLGAIIDREFEYLWIRHYAIFIYDENMNNFVPLFVDRDYHSLLVKTQFMINPNSTFIDFVKGVKDGRKVKDFTQLDSIKKAFDPSLLLQISMFWIYPFKVGDELVGFITIFNIRDESIKDVIDRHLKRFTKLLYSSIISIRVVDPEENKYIDNIEVIYRRINAEIMNSKDMNIPLTLVLFSVKNFKRYANLFGHKESTDLINKSVEIIRARLADSDFLARIDRNKILIVLPGKDKKFAVPLANAIRNEIITGFKKKEMQLLITFLMAEYPEDGENLQDLIDVID